MKVFVDAATLDVTLRLRIHYTTTSTQHRAKAAEEEQKNKHLFVSTTSTTPSRLPACATCWLLLLVRILLRFQLSNRQQLNNLNLCSVKSRIVVDETKLSHFPLSSGAFACFVSPRCVVAFTLICCVYLSVVAPF